MKLFTFVPDGITDCTVEAWIHQHDSPDENLRLPHPSIVVCPGGAYGALSARESVPVAEPYYAAGYNVFILNYSIKEQARDFRPLCQLAATVAHIRTHAQEYLTIADNYR